MAAPKQLTVLGLVFLLACLLSLLLWPQFLALTSGEPVGPGAPADEPRPGLLAAAAATRPAAGTLRTPAAREAIAVPERTPTGSLQLHVVWAEDQQPAAGVEVELYRSGADELFGKPRGRTDGAGNLCFDALAPGDVLPHLPLRRDGERKKATIVAGQQTALTLEVPPGIQAEGLVVDAQGNPVAGADLVVSDWGGGEGTLFGQSGADGRFALRAVAPHCHIGARKRGYVPSSLRTFTARPGARVEFRIVLAGRGGELRGIVLDPLGLPVAGAVVQAGDTGQRNHKLPDGASAMGPQCERVRTGADGSFGFASVEPGKVPLAVRARGLSPWYDTVAVGAGAEQLVTIRLQPGVTLAGTVRDAAGAPVAKAEIQVGEWSELGYQRIRTDAQGAYRFAGLAPGKLRARATSEAHGKADATLEATPGADLRWDPVLSAGLLCRGRVLDVEGKPVANAMVEANLETPMPGNDWYAHESTDREGRFTLKNCREGQPIRVTVRRKSMFREAQLTGHVPGPAEIVIRLPKEAWIHIQGKVLDADGRPLPGVQALPICRNDGGSPVLTVDAATGAFRYGPYPPGEYSLVLRAAGYPQIRVPWREIGPDETWDLGTLYFVRGGRIVVRARSAGAPVPDKLRCSIYQAGGEHSGSLQLEAGAGRSEPLAPGRYELQVGGSGIASGLHPCEVRADAETMLEPELGAGVAAPIECRLPPGTVVQAAIEVVIRDPAGKAVARAFASGRSGAAKANVTLAPGSYVVEATSATLRGRAELKVNAGAPVGVRVDLESR